jgi:hypothetical protein
MAMESASNCTAVVPNGAVLVAQQVRQRVWLLCDRLTARMSFRIYSDTTNKATKYYCHKLSTLITTSEVLISVHL